MAAALKAQADISKHEAVCAERWLAIRESMTDVRNAVSTLSKGAIGAAIAFSGWAAVQLYNHMDSSAHAQTVTVSRPYAK